MKHAVLALALSASLALPGCVIIDADEDDGYSASYSSPGGRTVNGALVGDDTVSIWVRSNGCTSKGDFSFDVDRGSDDVYSVEFRREDPDNCRRATFSEQLTWSFEELRIPEGSVVEIEHAVRG